MVDKFPGWRYGPKGEAEIFQTEADVPKGWTDNPNDFKKADTKAAAPEGDNPPVPPAPPAAFDRAAAVARLEAAGVKVKGNWGDKRIQTEVAKLPA